METLISLGIAMWYMIMGCACAISIDCKNSAKVFAMGAFWPILFPLEISTDL